MGEVVVLTVGHSTRTIGEFVALLKAHSVTMVVDVRTVPRSRYVPQFNAETLPASLKAAGIGYVHMPGLGGLRHSRKDSPNSGRRNLSFRGFADYMQTDEFSASLDGLVAIAGRQRVALMCAEAVPWRCHRSLIADALLVRGVKVGHLIGLNDARPHVLTPFARVDGTRLSYPS